MSETRFIPVHTLANRFESDILMSALQQEGIPAILRTFEETPYDGLFIAQRGWGMILVPDDHASRAREVIAPLVETERTEQMERMELDGQTEQTREGEQMERAEQHGMERMDGAEQTKREGKTYESPSEIDPFLWEQLRQADPEEIRRNAAVPYDRDARAYRVPFLDAEFLVLPDEMRIASASSTAAYVPQKLLFQFYLVVLHYLLEAAPEPLSGKWVGEKDIPGGSFFFRGPHEMPVKYLLKHFGSRPDAFRNAARRLKGVEIDAADAAFRLWVLPRVPMAFMLWEGDEEFEPAMRIRFDASVSSQFQALDTVWAMANVVAGSLVAAAGAD